MVKDERDGPGATKRSKSTRRSDAPIPTNQLKLDPEGPNGPHISLADFYGSEPFISRGDRI
jgi:hypothetical protein